MQYEVVKTTSPTEEAPRPPPVHHADSESNSRINTTVSSVKLSVIEFGGFFLVLSLIWTLKQYVQWWLRST